MPFKYNEPSANPIVKPAQKKEERKTIPSPTSGGRQANTSTTVRTAYQQNVSNYQPGQNTKPATTRSIFGQIMKLGQKNPQQANEVLNDFLSLQSDPTSSFYDPYVQATSPAVSALTSMGIDTSGITDDWLNQQNGFIESNLIRNGTTTTPSKPGKNATADQQAAYWLYHYKQNEATTKKAEQEWAALQQELKYWAGRTDMNLSDEQIMNRIDWNKYSTLSKMDADKANYHPTELNRSVGYSKDAMYGVLWNARNGRPDGDVTMGMAMSGLGEGVQWHDDPDVAAKLEWRNKDTYDPYSVGMTANDVGLYFGKNRITQKDVDEFYNTIDPNDTTAVDMVTKAQKSVDNYNQATAELSALDEKLAEWESRELSEEKMISKLDEWLEENAPMLMKMDDSLSKDKKPSDLVPMADTVPYRKQNIIARIKQIAEENGNKEDTGDLVNNVTGAADDEEKEPEEEDITKYLGGGEKEEKEEEPEEVDAVTGADVSYPSQQNLMTPTDLGPSANAGASNLTADAGKTNGNKTVSDTPYVKKPGAAPALTEEQQAMEKQTKEDYNVIAPVIYDKGTEAEQAAVLAGKTSYYDYCVERLLNSDSDFVTGMIQKSTDRAVKKYASKYAVTYDYDSHKQNLLDLQAKRNEREKELKPLKERQDATVSVLGLDGVQTNNLLSYGETPVNEDTEWGRNVLAVQQGYDPDAFVDYYSMAVNQIYDMVTDDYVGAGQVEFGEKEQKVNNWLDFLYGNNGKEMNPLSAEEQQRLTQLEQQIEGLDGYIQEEESYLSDKRLGYVTARMDRNFARQSYANAVALAQKNGKQIDPTLLDKIDSFYAYGNSSIQHQFAPYDYYSGLVSDKGQSREQAAVVASSYEQQYGTNIEQIESLMGYLTDIGVDIDQKTYQNIQNNLKELKWSQMEAGYVALDNNPDFDKISKAEIEKTKSVDWLANHTIDEDASILAEIYNNGHAVNLYPTERQKALSSISKDEIERYFYLLGKDGEEAASKYLDFLIDPEKGILPVRNQYELQKNAYEFANTPVGAYVSTPLVVLSGVMGWPAEMAYRIKQTIKGEPTNPYNSVYDNRVYSEAAFKGIQDAVTSGTNQVFGAGTIATGLNQKMLEIGMGLAKMQTGAAMMGSMFDAIGVPLNNLSSIVPRDLTAAAADTFSVKVVKSAAEVLPITADYAEGVYRQTKLETNDDEKAAMMYSVALTSGLLSHSVVMTGVHEAFQANPSGLTSVISQLFDNLLKTDTAVGVSTFVSDTIKQFAEKAILGEDSVWGKYKKKLTDLGYSEIMAAQAADTNMWDNICLDVFQSIADATLRSALTFGVRAISEKVANQIDEGIQKLKDKASVLKHYFSSSDGASEYMRAGDWANAPKWFKSVVPENAIVNPINGAKGTKMYDRTTGKEHKMVAYMITDSGDLVYIDNKGEQISIMKIMFQNGQPASNLTEDETSLLKSGWGYYKDQYTPPEQTRSWKWAETPGPETETETDQENAIVPATGMPEQIKRLPSPTPRLTTGIGVLPSAKDLTIVGEMYNGTPTAAAVGLTALLENPDPNVGKAAGQTAVTLAGDSPKVLSSAMQQMITNTPNPINLKNDMVIASLVSGNARQALLAIFDKVKEGLPVLAEDVDALHNGAADDRADSEAVSAAIDSAVTANRVANRTMKIIQETGGVKKLQDASQKVEDAKTEVAKANESLETQQDVEIAKADAVERAKDEFLQNPDHVNSDNMNHAVQEQKKALEVTEEYRQSVENAKEGLEQAKQDKDQTENEVINSARQEADVQVKQEMAAEQTERDAQAQAAAEAEQQRNDLIAQEEAAYQMKRKGWEDEARSILTERGLSGEYLERNVQKWVNLKEQQDRGTVDTSRLLIDMDTAETNAFLHSLSKISGISISSADLGDPRFIKERIDDRQNLYFNSRMPLSASIIRAVSHGVTHGLELTGAYKEYASLAMKILYGGRETEQYKQEIDRKKRDYASQSVPLDDVGAERELVAEFTAHHLADKKFVRKAIAKGFGSQVRKSLSTSLEQVKGYRFKGEARRTISTLKRAERLFWEGMDEKARDTKNGFNGHTGITQFSITGVTNAAGLTVEVTGDKQYMYKLYDKEGNELAPGEYTPEMVKGTPVGRVIDLSAKFQVESLKDRLEKGLITEREYSDSISNVHKTMAEQRQFISDIVNMIGQYQDAAMVWELAGSLAFSTLKVNSDKQYNDSYDMGSICTKTMAILKAISKTQLRLKRGLTKDEIDNIVYLEVGKGVYDEETGKWKHGATPCPPCYVYATWVNKPARLEKIRNYQIEYNDWTDEQITEFMNQPDPVGRTKTETKDLTTEQNSRKLWISLCLADEHIDPKTKEVTWTRKENPDICPNEILLDLERSGDMATQYPGTWLFMQKGGNALGKAIVPYSDSRLGESIVGKAIGAGRLNEMLLEDQQNAQNPDYVPQFLNPFLVGVDAPNADKAQKQAEEYFKKAIAKAKEQNLKGGQRWQSWSDFRAEWGSDYLMEMLTMQALGATVQTYTKVPEAMDLFASAGFEVNMSLMPDGDGFAHNEDGSIKLDEDGNKILKFSPVTGINPEAAEDFAKRYGKQGNVQPMVVGISDEHITAALAGDYITFVIPFHGSGGSVQRVQHLMKLLGEKLNTGSDYTNVQTDSFIDYTEVGSGSNKRKVNNNYYWKLREAIITGQYDTLTDKQKDDIDEEESGLLKKLYEDRYVNEDSKSYHVFFNVADAQQIYPYEYWDTSTTLENADENGMRFIKYCQLLGVTPRFSGIVRKAAKGKFFTPEEYGIAEELNPDSIVRDEKGRVIQYEYGNFSGMRDDGYGNITYNPVHGYWKLLIDRPMYNRVYDENGKLVKEQCTYHEPQAVNVGNIKVGLMPKAANNTVGHNEKESDIIADRIADIIRNGALASAMYPTMTLGNTPSEERAENAPVIRKAMYADSDVQLSQMSAAGEMYDEEILQAMKEKSNRFALTNEPLSDSYKSIRDRLMAGESVSADEVEATPEIQHILSIRMEGSSMDPALLDGFDWYDMESVSQIESMLPAEQVEEQHRIKAELDSRGSAVIDKNGHVEYNGPVKQGNRVDVILGLAASGKSSIADRISQQNGSILLDADQVKELHHLYMGGANEDYVHFESKFINDQRTMESAERGDNIIVQVLGENPESVLRRLEYFKNKGYEIHLHMTDLQKNKALGRALNRTAKTGRYHDYRHLEKADPEKIAATFDLLKGSDLIDGYAKWNTDVPRNEQPIPVEYSDDREIGIFGQDLQRGSAVQDRTQAGQPGNPAYAENGFYNGSGSGGLIASDDSSETSTTENGGGAFSVGGEMYDEELLSIMADNGIISPELIPYSYVPSTRIDFGSRQRQFGSKTAQESDALHEQVKQYLFNNSSYTPDTNDAQISRAITWVRGHATESDPDGYYSALKEVMDPNFNYRTADGQARMLTVMGMAALKADQGDERALQDEIDLADAYNKQGTDLGQALQARKLFRLMTPVGRKALLQREADRINQNLADLGKKYRVAIPDELLEEGANAKTEKDFKTVQRKIRKVLNEQIPVTWGERIIGWRMLSMLSSPKTHLRNVSGNLTFVPLVGAKNKVAAIIEAGAQAFGAIDKSERTKNIGLSDPAARKFASARAKEIKDVLRGNAKYGEGDLRQQERKLFGTKNDPFSKTFGKALQWWYDKNGQALEWEDWIFLKYHYTRALGGYMTARGLKPEDMTGTVLEEADLYAIQEAHKATYRDESGVANWLNRIGSKKTNANNNKALSVIQWIVNTRLPFKRTPINIAKRGIEYSPVGLGKSLTYDAKCLKQYLDAKNGKLEKMPKSAISPTQWIDKFSAGLTGTLVMVAGAVAAALGIARAGFNKNDPGDQIDKIAGEKEYSLKYGKLANEIIGLKLFDEDVSVTLDWAMPSVLSFFTGVGLFEYLTENGFSVGGLLDLLMEVTDPMLNMSFMSGVSDIFKNNSYSTKDGFWQFIEKTGINFITSLVPTLSGQIANTVDGSRTTYKGGESLTGDEDIDKMIQQLGNKIPWLSFGGIPYTNTLGEEPEHVIPTWVEQILSPGYFTKSDSSAEMKELKRLYLVDPDDNKRIIPAEPDRTVKIDGKSVPLNGEQYVQLKADHGAAWREATQKLVENPLYAMASDDSRAAMYDLADSYATQVAKYKFDSRYKIKPWAESAYKNGNVDDVIINEVAKTNKTNYVKAQTKSFAEALITDNRGDISKYSKELESAHAESSTVRKQLTEYFKPLYKQAYEQNDETTMENIEYILENINDYVELDKEITKYTKNRDFNKWITSTDTVSDEEDEDENDWLNMD